MTDQRKTPIAEADIPDWDGDDDEERSCWQCRGEGWGIVGVDWDPSRLDGMSPVMWKPAHAATGQDWPRIARTGRRRKV